MVRQPRKNHPKNSNPKDAKFPCDLSPTDGTEEPEALEIEQREFGGTVSDSVAEILSRIPILDRIPADSPSSADLEEVEALQANPNPEPRRKPEETKMQTVGTGQKIKAVDSVRETISQDGAVLLDIRQGLCFSMNPVGSRIWAMIKKDYALEQIASSLEAEFQVPRSQIDADISAFLAELRNRKLIQEDGSDEKQDRSTWLSKFIKLAKPART